MENRIDLSVVIACYNVGPYLGECLQSLSKTTFPHNRIEILAVNDGSTDGVTPKIIKKYSQLYSFIKGINKPNGGLSDARNCGMDHAKGKYIAFVDGDDIVPPSAYTNLMYVAETQKSNIVSGFVRRFDNLKNVRSFLHKRAIKDNIYQTTIDKTHSLIYDTTAWNKVYNKKFLVKNHLRFIKGILYEDLPFTLEAQLKSNNSSLIKNTVYNWRWRSNSITESRSALYNYTSRLASLNRCRIELFRAGYDAHSSLYHDFIFKVLTIDLPIFLQNSGDTTEDYIYKMQEITYQFLRNWNLLDSPILHLVPVKFQLIYYAVKTGDLKLLTKYTYRKSIGKFRSYQFSKNYDYTIPKINSTAMKNIDVKHNTLRHSQSLNKLSENESKHAIYGCGMFRIKRLRMLKKPLTTNNYHEKLTASLINKSNNLSVQLDFHRQKTPLYKRVLRPRTSWTNARYWFQFNYQEAAKILGAGKWLIKVTDNVNNQFIVIDYLGSPTHLSKARISPIKYNNLLISTSVTNNWKLEFNVNNVRKLNDEKTIIKSPFIKNNCLVFSTDIKISNDNIQPQLIFSKANQQLINGKITNNHGRSFISFNLKHFPLSKPYHEYPIWLIHKKTNYHIPYGYDLNTETHTLTLNDTKQIQISATKSNLKAGLQYRPFRIRKYYIKNGRTLVLDGVQPGIIGKDKISYNRIELISNGLKHRYLFKSFGDGEIDIPLVNRKHSNLKVLKGTYHLIDYVTFANRKTICYGFQLLTDDMNEKAKLDLKNNVAQYRIKAGNNDNFLLKIYQPWTGFSKSRGRRAISYSLIYPFMRLLPLRKDVAVFDSYWASQFSSNEKAIYEYMQHYNPNIHSVWFLKNNQLPIDGNGERVKTKSLKYWYYLATAKYIFQNTNMPNRYYKRNGQVEVETLHGTFLKHMGFDEPHFRNASKKIQNNFARRIRRWDYMIVPSNYMKDIASHAFDYHQKIIPSGFPRTDSLVKNNNKSYIMKIRHRLGIPNDKKIILYAPTFRNSDRDFHFNLDEMEHELSDKYVLLVRLHYFVAHSHSFYNNPGFVYDVSDYKNCNDLLLISDVLITDYSSIMFDYSYLRRPMIFYAYDKDIYLNNAHRGVYLDYEKAMPGPIDTNEDEVISDLKTLPIVAKEYKNKINRFADKFAQYGQNGDATKQVVKKVIDEPNKNLDQEPDKYVIFNKMWHLLKIHDLQAALLNHLSRILPKKNIIIFDSFFGTQYSDNPKALYLYIKKHYPQFKLYWNVNREDVPFFEKHQIPYVQRFSYSGIVKQAEAKYWIVNARRPFRWYPDSRTVVLQTWHGTPLKTIGADVSLVTMPGNNAKKYHKQVYKDNRRWNYLLVPNMYSEKIMKRAFRKKGNQLMLSGYPRNDVLINHNDKATINKIKDSLHINHYKKVVLYAPTWRDNEFIKSDEYVAKIHLNLDKIKKHFGNKVLILIRTHYMISNQLDLSDYKGTALDVSSYPDIAELYLISDVLITDYSSVMFDYSILKRPMIFFDYDFANYAKSTRGFYFDFRKVAPGPIVTSTDGVIRELDNIFRGNWYLSDNYKKFINTFDKWMDGKASARVCKALFNRHNVYEHSISRHSLDLPKYITLCDGTAMWKHNKDFTRKYGKDFYGNYDSVKHRKYHVIKGMQLQSLTFHQPVSFKYILIDGGRLSEPVWVNYDDVICVN